MVEMFLGWRKRTRRARRNAVLYSIDLMKENIDVVKNNIVPSH